MPNPLIAKSFTPAVNCTLVCTATYSVQQNGTASDWGSATPGVRMRLTRDSDSAQLQVGPKEPISRTRMPQTYRVSFACAASDGAQTVRLEGTGGAPGEGVTCWDLNLTIEVVKR